MGRKIDFNYLSALQGMKEDLQAQTDLLQERIEFNKRLLENYEREISLLQNQEG